ncbi:uncharacterized protein LOC142047209 [Chelonoidis abingdonii]|uniref:uncharacterized protein LOC142047209 n=1 Tax=Chelonoidis abingdonii TaxID=106734 RepID=UPI003F497236
MASRTGCRGVGPCPWHAADRADNETEQFQHLQFHLFTSKNSTDPVMEWICSLDSGKTQKGYTVPLTLADTGCLLRCHPSFRCQPADCSLQPQCTEAVENLGAADPSQLWRECSRIVKKSGGTVSKLIPPARVIPANPARKLLCQMIKKLNLIKKTIKLRPDKYKSENVSQKKIQVKGQVEALTEKEKGKFVMGNELLTSTACKSEPEMGNCDLLEVAQGSEKSSSLSVGSGNVPGELMAVSSQQFGKTRIVEDECPYPLPVSYVENCNSEGNVPVSVRGIDLPMEEATSVSKQLSVNSPVCWDKGNEIPSCVSGEGECVSSFSVSVEQTEGAFQPVMVKGNSVVSELVVNTAKAQEGNGPEFLSAGKDGTVTRLHPVCVLAKLEKGVAALSKQGDTLARAQGEQKGDLIVLPTNSLTTCNKEEIIPNLVCVEPNNLQVASDYKESCQGKESTSNVLSRESMSLPEKKLCRNLPNGPKVILNVSKTQKESVVAQGSVPLEQALGEKGKGRSSERGELLLRKAAKERNPHGNLCKQFTAAKGCESDLIKEVLVPNSQKFSVVNGSTDFPVEKSSGGSFEKVSNRVEAVTKVKQPCNQVAVCVRGQLVGKTMLLKQKCLHASVCVNANYLTSREKKDLLIAVSTKSPPPQPVNLVKREKSGFGPAEQGEKRRLNFAKGSHRLTLKCPNSNGVDPKVWHDKQDCNWTLAMNLLLLLMVIFATSVLLLPRIVRMYRQESCCKSRSNPLFFKLSFTLSL